MSSRSGIGINSDVMTKCRQLKAFRYIICVIKNGEIVVDRTGNRDATYEDMLAQLSLESPAYVIVDLKELIEGVQKILLLHWMPSESRIKDRMLYSSAKEAIERTCKLLFGGVVVHEACDFEEASLMSVSEKLLTGNIK